MIPVLYSPTEREFEHNGIGHLVDCIMCEVTEERNGAFELQLQYPINGRYAADLQQRSIIKATADEVREPQLFRTYGLSKPIGGIVTVKAAHISYDLNGAPVAPYTASSAQEAMQGLSDMEGVFSFATDIDSAAHFESLVPVSARSCLGGIEHNILTTYGGELEWDNFAVRLLSERGADRGVAVRYGKNLTDFNQEENCASVYTGVYPYWQRTDTVNNEAVRHYFELPERVVMATGNYSFSRILPLDLSSVFEETPSEEQLRSAAVAYMDENNIGVPEVSVTVSFVPLYQTEEYRHVAELERVALCDTVSVFFPMMGVEAKAKVVKVVWDTLRDRYKSMTLGSIRKNAADLIAYQGAAISTAQQNTKAFANGQLNAPDFTLYGSFTVKAGDSIGGRLGYMSGLRGDGTVTNGIGMRNADGSCYVIVTDGGVRLQAGEMKIVITPEGCFANDSKIG